MTPPGRRPGGCAGRPGGRPRRSSTAAITPLRSRPGRRRRTSTIACARHSICGNKPPRSPMKTVVPGRRPGGGSIALIAVTAGYEILAAAQVIAYPADAASGDSLPFQTPLLELTYLAMALGSIVFLAAAFWGRLRDPAGTRMLWLTPLVAAALVLGKNYSFDSYDLPSLVRYADDGSGELLDGGFRSGWPGRPGWPAHAAERRRSRCCWSRPCCSSARPPPFSPARSTSSAGRGEPLRDPVGDHHRGNVRVRAGHDRHHRRVGDVQMLGAVHAAAGVDNRRGVGAEPHRARPHRVPVVQAVAADDPAQVAVRIRPGGGAARLPAARPAPARPHRGRSPPPPPAPAGRGRRHRRESRGRSPAGRPGCDPRAWSAPRDRGSRQATPSCQRHVSGSPWKGAPPTIRGAAQGMPRHPYV